MARKEKKYEEPERTREAKRGRVEGLSAIVRITEEVNVEQDHYANIKSINFNGALNVENPSTVDRLWDIKIAFADAEGISLDSNEIVIQELGVKEDDNTDTREFEITGEAQNLLLVKEYVSSMSDADSILNARDIETDLLTLKGEGGDADVEDEEYDVASEGSLESFGISINKVNPITFAIGVYSLFEKPITEVVVTKNIPGEFENVRIGKSSIGRAKQEGDQIIWTIDELAPKRTALLKFTADLLIETKDAVKTGTIDLTYKAASSFTGGLEITETEGMTNNKHYMDLVERDEEPGVWDCNLVFENPSEFKIDLYQVDVSARDEPDSKFVELDEPTPILAAKSQWNSPEFQYESDEYPTFNREINFRIFAEMEADVSSTIAIEDVELVLASIGGKVTLEEPEIVVPTDEENVIALPSYKDNEIPTILKYVNDGSAPLDEVKVTQKGFDDKFRPPQPDEIEVLRDGKPVDVLPENITVTDDSVEVLLPDLRDSPEGMLESDSVIEVKYPVHAVSPPADTEFVTDVVYNGNTYPLGPELEYIPAPEEIPVIKVVHVRRKYRVGKRINPIGAFGQYQIEIIYENLGNMPLKDYILVDKVPDNFKYSGFSLKPEITDEHGSDTLKWEIEELAEGDKLEITYEIKGAGAYNPSDAQLMPA